MASVEATNLMEKAISVFDTSPDATISIKEFEALVRGMPSAGTETEVQQMVEEASNNSANGRIRFETFASAFLRKKNREELKYLELLQKRLGELDSNKDGYLTVTQIKQALNCYPFFPEDKFLLEDRQALLRIVDKNPNEKIKHQEFYKMMEKVIKRQ